MLPQGNNCVYMQADKSLLYEQALIPSQLATLQFTSSQPDRMAEWVECPSPVLGRSANLDHVGSNPGRVKPMT